MKTRYISTKQIEYYLNGKKYASIHRSGSLIGMKKNFGWDKASEIIYSGNYIYCIL